MMLLLLAAAAIAPAQSDDARAMIACRSLTDDTARLACYDRAVQRIDADPADREKASRAQRERFGLAGANAPAAAVARQARPEKIERIDAKVRSVGFIGDGRYSILLDDGATWVFVEEISVQPKVGDAVVIRRGLLGSYMGSVNGRREVRVQRRR